MKRSNPALPDFFPRVARAAFANPFLPARREADLRIAGLDRDVPDRVERALREVTTQVEALERAGLADVRRWRGEERRVLGLALLFDAFHRVAGPFDRLIADQQRAGETSLRIDFARATFDLLEQRGFSPEAARRYFALFYQLRRAYHFISNGLTGDSDLMEQLRARLWTNLFTHDVRWYDEFLWNRLEDFSTLLTGETGTGKGAAAAALGRSAFIPFDDRRGAFAESFVRGFTSLNLSQFPPALLESELFGHRKGAFTGAVEEHEGVLARCSPHGAIFLDEIGEVGPAVQIKLLTVLQDRAFTPVGSHERRTFRGRVIAATNRPLAALRGPDGLRPDFFYRLCSDVIEVPSLRQRLQARPAELGELVRLLTTRLAGPEAVGLAAQVEKQLRAEPGRDYAWPGNVRELEQAVRRVLLTGRYTPPPAPATAVDPAAALAARVRGGELTAEQLVADYCRQLHGQLGTYEAVAARVQLDRRTVRKYIVAP